MEAKKKFFLFGAFTGIILLISYVFSQPDGNLHLVFCDVGQGDAIYIKFPDGTDGLVDAGPNNKVLNCLGKQMAFWDRKIEMVILTHPQADHLTGLLEVLKRYEVEMLVLPAVGNETKGYSELEKIIKEKKVNFANLYKDNVVQFRDRSGKALGLRIVWPEEQWAREKLQLAGIDFNWSKNILGASTHQNLNDFSIVTLVSFGDFDVLLTGDLEADLLERAVKDLDKKIEVLKISHHGGKNGLSKNIVDSLKPKLAVISVGKNSYGHPSDVTLNFLKENNVQTLRTDEEGDIEIISDGEKWEIKTSNQYNL